jgi:ElaB/YqjD/DUF883 family membrane-anchored ribosome-binding protein
MSSSLSIQNDVNELKREVAGLRSDYARLKHRAAATKEDRVKRFARMKENVTDTIGSIKDTIADGTSATLDDISGHFNEFSDVVHGYAARTERTVAAHPIAAVAGAVTIGYLVGRLAR